MALTLSPWKKLSPVNWRPLRNPARSKKNGSSKTPVVSLPPLPSEMVSPTAPLSTLPGLRPGPPICTLWPDAVVLNDSE